MNGPHSPGELVAEKRLESRPDSQPGAFIPVPLSLSLSALVSRDS